MYSLPIALQNSDDAGCTLFVRFWGMLGYLANTLIFILVGVVIAQRAFSGVESLDWMFMVALYIGIMVIRSVAD